LPRASASRATRPTTPDDLRKAFAPAVESNAMHLIEGPVA
jgi:hypothetical protein